MRLVVSVVFFFFEWRVGLGRVAMGMDCLLTRPLPHTARSGDARTLQEGTSAIDDQPQSSIGS